MEQTNQNTEIKEQEQAQQPEKLMTYSETKAEIKKELAEEMVGQVFSTVMQRIQKTFLIDDRFTLKQEAKQPQPPQETTQKEMGVSKDYVEQVVKDMFKQMK